MKKAYIAPKSESFSINLEGMIATSPGQQNMGFDNGGEITNEDEILSNRGSVWSQENWTDE